MRGERREKSPAPGGFDPTTSLSQGMHSTAVLQPRSRIKLDSALTILTVTAFNLDFGCNETNETNGPIKLSIATIAASKAAIIICVVKNFMETSTRSRQR